MAQTGYNEADTRAKLIDPALRECDWLEIVPDDSSHWYRAHGNEQWEFDERGLMRRREASINDAPPRKRTPVPLGGGAASGGSSHAAIVRVAAPVSSRATRGTCC